MQRRERRPRGERLREQPQHRAPSSSFPPPLWMGRKTEPRAVSPPTFASGRPIRVDGGVERQNALAPPLRVGWPTEPRRAPADPFPTLDVKTHVMDVVASTELSPW